MTRQEDKAKDANVILKDLDLTRQLHLPHILESIIYTYINTYMHT